MNKRGSGPHCTDRGRHIHRLTTDAHSIAPRDLLAECLALMADRGFELDRLELDDKYHYCVDDDGLRHWYIITSGTSSQGHANLLASFGDWSTGELRSFNSQRRGVKPRGQT